MLAINKIIFEITRDSKISRVREGGISRLESYQGHLKTAVRAPLFLLLFLGGYRDGAPDCDHHLNYQ